MFCCVIVGDTPIKTLGVIERAGDVDEVDIDDCMENDDLEDIEALLSRVKQETLSGPRLAREALPVYTRPARNRKRYCKRIGRVMVETRAHRDPKLHAEPVVELEDIIQKILRSYD